MRIILSIALAVALLVALSTSAFAQNPTVTITVKGELVAITNSQNAWNLGAVVPSATPKWGGSDEYSTVTNTGNVNVDVEIQGTDLVAVNTTFNWALAADGDPDDQIYGLKATITSTYNITVKKTPFNDLVTNLPHSESNTVTWSMTLYAPTAFHASDDGLDKTATVTLVASKSA